MGQVTTWHMARERRACGSRGDPLLWLSAGHDARGPTAGDAVPTERNIALCGRLALPRRPATDGAAAAAVTHAAAWDAPLPGEEGASGDAGPRVDLAASLRDTCVDIARSLGSGLVAFRLELARLECPAGRSVPVALIAGELVANALKHAFPRGRRGRIHVRLSPDGAGRALLSVSDDGVGLPAAAARGRTLGLRLVDELAAELGGTVVTVRGDGTCVSLCWPL